MALYVDIEPLKAMELFYEGEELGFWEGDFIKNEKQKGLVYPQMLKEYLQKYGFFGVNRGDSRFWLPDDARLIKINMETETKDMYLLGVLGTYCIGIFAEDCNEEDPPVSFGESVELDDGRNALSFGDSGMYLSDVLLCLFAGNIIPGAEAGKTYDTKEEAEEILGRYSFEPELKHLIDTAPRPYRFICYDDEEKKFLCVDLYSDDEYGDYEIIAVFSPGISTEELESLFSREFYENSMNCDFARALHFMEKIIERMEHDKSGTYEIGEKYRLAARCCWALEQWDKAEEWLKKAEPIFNLDFVPPQSKMSYYRGLGNFYTDKGDKEKGAAAYEMEEQIARENGISLFKVKGDHLMNEGMKLSEEDRLEEAIELFEKALEQFRQDPRGCKYEIARCGQLKGDAKSTIKKRLKAAQGQN